MMGSCHFFSVVTSALRHFQETSDSTMAAFGGGNPFGNGGNPFGGGGPKGGLGMLKKKATPKSFVDLDMSLLKKFLWKKNATMRMRDIDCFRLHVPEAKERRKFNIPESIDRVNLHDQKHLMVLCGGYAGVRFSSEVSGIFWTLESSSVCNGIVLSCRS